MTGPVTGPQTVASFQRCLHTRHPTASDSSCGEQANSPPGTRSKALLIFPLSFYSFVEVIKEALTELGYDVIVANHEYPDNAFGKILGKLRIFWLLEAITQQIFHRNYIKNKRYSVAIIVKGRGISKRLLRELHTVATRIVAYSFDSFDYNPAPLRWYKNVDNFYTFDYLDADKYSLSVVELFSSIPPLAQAPQHRAYDISAILRNHSHRLKYLDKVRELWPNKTYYIYIYEQNIVSFLLNLIRNPMLYWKYRTHIHFEALPYNHYVSILRNSFFTLDFAHPKQSGITVRCFEALSVQTKVITNNRYVIRSPYFDEDNTIILRADAQLRQATATFDRIRDNFVEARPRTVYDFLGDLLAEKPIQVLKI